MSGQSIGALREALISAMDLGGVAGNNLHESREALIEADGDYWRIDRFVVEFRNGRFVFVLKAGEPDQ
jgi:hypothetical protein